MNKFTTKEYIELIDEALFSYLKVKTNSLGEEKMHEAMTYSVENGGKRIRPMLVLEFCRICGGDVKSALPFACALEFIHTYSLIHDDLPCMDDDDMRRGKPSSHIKFGEANALLAGDSLLTYAFKTAASAKNLSADKIVEAVTLLSEAAGCAGMIGGQVLDLYNEERTDAKLEDLKQVDDLKTGELIRAACLLGCIAAGADDEKREAARVYAANLGLAFQVVDDILDVTSDAETLGKPIGSDAQNSKNTYVSLLGLDGAKTVAKQLTDNAINALKVFAPQADFLIELSENLLSRSN